MFYAQSVTIGPRFFSKAFNDYSNRFWAFAREMMQNSIDCGSKMISIEIHERTSPEGDAETHVTVENNGEPMSLEILRDKLLSLGESGKEFQGSVGGFGKAKEILYFAHKRYMIWSGDWYVHGSGAGYDMNKAETPLKGTRSHVVWEGHHGDELIGQFGRFIQLCGTEDRCKFCLNGKPMRPHLPAGEVVRTLDEDGQPWSNVSLSNAEKGRIVVRVSGIPMFATSCDYKGTVILELTGTSAKRLTSNRDGLRYPYNSRLGEFITTIAIDKKTAFVLERAEYKRIEGTKLQHVQPAKPAPPSDEPKALAVAAQVDSPEPKGGAGIKVETLSKIETPPAGILDHEFIVKNCVRKAVPPQYDPDSEKFDDYAKWIVKAWTGCLLELHAIFEVNDTFSVGFIFSKDVIAESEHGDYGQVYYLNPCHVTKRGHTRRLKKASRFDIATSAAHEFVHGAMGESYHGEDFASKLTRVMSTLMNHHRKFAKHVS